jgi:ATP/maltotriose-dependent transcriptional regulator MalT
VTRGEAQRLLELSRKARWAFPSSMGRPVPKDDEPEWLRQLIAAQASIVDAARFFVQNGEEDAATELAANVWRLWILSRDIDGGRAFLAEVLDRGAGQPSRARALALYGDGLLAFWQGAHDDARGRNEAALEAARASGDPEALALAHIGLDRVAFEDGDYGRARELAAQAREYARTVRPAMEQGALHGHAQASRMLGDDDGAAALFEESLALNRRIGDEGMVAVELHNLGHVEIRRGNVKVAERYFSELGEHASPDDPYSAAMSHLNKAALAYGRGDNDRASALLASARSALEQAGMEPFADDRYELDWLTERVT